ncbi:chitinase 2 [Lathyrus oleraceus]|uniref:GH18 domain-containing protein n=1 Tax=Pisum sativum TaxID=3888 RepID=A0A9D5BM19_PEA|nr:chitinase 2-like [Pisum sativum]KAI5446109.1 hypothetical protein KIW84_014092 [Pisum sativum]
MLEPEFKAVLKPTIFREYINGSLDDYPAGMINDNMKEFHFILGFATDTYVNGKGTGVFTRTWNFKNLGPAQVLKLIVEHRNVKVVISIGGQGPEDVFNPQNRDIWIANAKSSIKDLILDYKIDVGSDGISTTYGIDINYENIDSSVDDFAYCIGNVIQQLKEDEDLSYSMCVVSIAPTEALQRYYLRLYLKNKDKIDWINYKFYKQSFDSEIEFVKLFKRLVYEYGAPFKLLAGVSTDTITSKSYAMTTEFFVKGCTILLNTASLAGVFVWDANSSAPRYSLEEQIQKLFTKK